MWIDAERWQQIKGILDVATNLETAERPRYVAQIAGQDRDLYEEVASLLSFHDEASPMLDRPVFDVNARDPALGRRIGPYRLEERIGRGGMGVVYRAQRQDDFAKQVAIKLIHRGAEARDQIARFHAERQILADLEHPAIARLLDGGTTPEGLPYLVMELAEGEPIDRYCDGRRLGVRERLGLFRQVLQAVAFSHRHLVVHRDLKPGNILVTAEGVPKLIDFGIARLLQPAVESPAAPAQRHLTLRYASPEQIRGDAVTTGCDVYALGIVLYELLSGHHPYETAAGDAELVQAICSGTPPPPSVLCHRPAPVPGWTGEVLSAEAVAAARGTQPARLARQLAEELDAIVLKALAPTPEARYASVEQLAEDIDHYLAGRPIRARQPSLWYRARKLVRRHRLAIVAAVLALAVLGSTATSLTLRRRVERERAQNAAMGEFVTTLFSDSDPNRSAGQELTALDILERGRDRLGPVLADQPLQRAAIFGVIGRVYQALGDRTKAGPLLAEALRLQRLYDPDDRAAVARRANEFAAVLHQQGDFGPAQELYAEALQAIGGCSARNPDAARIARNLAWLESQTRDFAEAEKLLECVGQRPRGNDPTAKLDLASTQASLCAVRYNQGKFAEAKASCREALALRQDVYGTALDSRVADVLDSLGKVLHAQGHDDEAREKLQRALAIQHQLFAEDHPDIANSEKNLAQVLTALGEAEAAEPLARHALEILRSKPVEAWQMADAKSVLGGCLLALGRWSEAASLLEESYPVIVAAKGADSPYARDALARLTTLRRLRDPSSPPT